MNDIFVKNKILIGIFFLCFTVLTCFYFKYSVGLFFDIPSCFLSAIFSSMKDGHASFIFFDNILATRLFDDILVAVPFNLIKLFFKNPSMDIMIKIFSTSYFIVHLSCLIMNYLIARRTKRYDIAVICFSFYALFSVANAIWIIREIHIALLFYFAILSYFLSYEKLGKKDILPISLILLYLFESFETTIIFGVILYVFTIFYCEKKKDGINNWAKSIIGFISLLASIYILINTLFMEVFDNIDLFSKANEWLSGTLISIKTLFQGNMMICLFALILITFALFYKKEFHIKNISFVILCAILCAFILYKTTGFISDVGIELQNYSYILWFIFPVVILILLADYFQFKINYNFYSNLLIISCIFGILNILWQIHSFYEFGKCESYLKNLLNNSKQTIVKIPDEDLTKYSFLKYNTCYGAALRAIFLIGEYKKDKIIFPTEKYDDYSEFCYFNELTTYYNKDFNIIYIQDIPLQVKNKYWDLTPIKDEFINTGRVR